MSQKFSRATRKSVRAHAKSSIRSSARAFVESLELRTLLSLVVDVRLAGGGKDYTITSGSEVINLEVYATVTGDDASGANEGLSILAGSFLSTNVSGGAALGDMAYSRVSPFNAIGSSDGTQADLDSDGDLDVGSNNDAVATGFFVARANPTATNGTVTGPSMEFLIATGSFSASSLLSGGTTEIVFRPRTTATSFLYIKDGTPVNGSLGGTIAGGAPLILRLPAPTGSISGQKFNDLDGDGVKDAGENGIAGVTIDLDRGPGGPIDASTVTDALGNYTFSGLVADTYRLRETVPSGSIQTTSDPADIVLSSGQNVTGVDFGNFTLISVSGQKFDDTDGDGIKDAGENGIAGVTINLDNGANGSVDATTVTDADGNYTFSNLGPGTYRVRETVPSGYTQTTADPADIAASSGANVAGVDFGNQLLPVVLGSISGQKFNDLDGDGVKDAGEAGLDGWTIQLDAGADGSVDATIVTSGGGNYSFANLSAGTYRVREVGQSGWIQTTVNPLDVGVAGSTNSTGNDFGNFQLGSISGIKFEDNNGNGVRNGPDGGLAGWTIELDKNADGTVDATTVTEAGGAYSFTGLTAGVYRIREVGQANWIQTTVNPDDVTIASGTNSTGNYFGNFNLITISGQKFNDADNDGVKDAGEGGVAGVTIFLDDDNDEIFDSGETSTTTDSSGNYSFAAVGPGTYRVREVVPAGSTQTTVNPAAFNAISGSPVSGLDFGNYTPSQATGSITGQKFNDLDGDGMKDANEPGVAGVTINLDAGANGSVDDTTTTDAQGNYTFSNLPAGTYRVREVLLSGTTQTTTNPADIIVNGNAVTGVLFGNFTLISISGTKFNDADGDGVFDSGELGVAGVTIQLDLGANGSIDATAVTNLDGTYSFNNLGPGVYRVREVAPSGTTQTTPNPADIVASSGTNAINVNFGNRTNPTPTGPAITGYKFNDLDGDGKWDSNEPGQAGVTITLDRDANGSVNDSTVTDASGFYAFYGLTNNKKYRIREIVPAGTKQTTSNPADITVKSNRTYANNNFGNFTLISIAGQKFNDANGNGIKDSGEEGVKGVKITLDTGANGSVNATTYSDASGYYAFTNLGPGKYRVREVAPSGTTQTTPNPGDFTAISGENIVGVDFGNYCPPPPPPPPGAGIEVVTDPSNSGLTALRISGTDAGEKIEVLYTDQQGKAQVKVDGVSKGTFNFTGAIVVNGNGGSDNVRVDSKITRSAYIFGGSGDDYLAGGGGNDVILGESGKDQLYGNGKRDVLIGGADRDTLNGGDDEDLVVGGRTAFDASFNDLAALGNEWSRTDKVFSARVTSIRGAFLTASNAIDDGAKDASSGGAGMDLFYSKYSGPSANQDDGPDYSSGYDNVFDV